VFEPPPEESGGGFVFGLREYLVQREELSRTGSVERHEAEGRIGGGGNAACDGSEWLIRF